jgi:hypothetical protein
LRGPKNFDCTVTCVGPSWLGADIFLELKVPVVKWLSGWDFYPRDQTLQRPGGCCLNSNVRIIKSETCHHAVRADRVIAGGDGADIYFRALFEEILEQVDRVGIWIGWLGGDWAMVMLLGCECERRCRRSKHDDEQQGQYAHMTSPNWRNAPPGWIVERTCSGSS